MKTSDNIQVEGIVVGIDRTETNEEIDHDNSSLRSKFALMQSFNDLW
jgi:hypothetical protein